MTDKRILLDLYPQELKACLEEMGEPAFRAKQVFQWLHKGVAFTQMRNLPGSLREKLAAGFYDLPMDIHRVFASQKDDTVKFLFACKDGHLIESVLMHYHYGYTLCISTQVGCKMGCAFCASTIAGCVRNLSAGEMLAQVLLANRYLAEKGEAGQSQTSSTKRQRRFVETVGHVVLMGSGEPLDNYVETIRFLRLVNHPEGLHIGLRNVSLSTCGLVPRIYDLAEEGLPVTLSISLHAPNDEIRQTIMPVARRYPISQVMEAARAYVQKTGRRVVFEYALIRGLNSEPSHAKELAKLLGGLQCHVNLIPLNRVEESSLIPATPQEVQTFLKTLESLHVSATCRREMGTDIHGACGQLRHQYLKKSAEIDTIS